MKPTKTELIARAKKLGKAGFKAGKKAPAQDAKMMAMLEGMKVGDPIGMKLLLAWDKGWHEEHTKETDKELRRKGIIIPRMKAKIRR